MNQVADRPPASEPVSRASAEATSTSEPPPSFFGRDNIENILVAVILALLFRGFEAEAFVIPTGSMAPTLMGRHKDLVCDECGCRFQTGESLDPEPEGGRRYGRHAVRPGIEEVSCPNCRYPLDTAEQRRRFKPYTGDRILVNKFAYEYEDPQRWDVIVFKFPGNAKQNYIKRLVGLPNETLTIRHGDVFSGSSTTDLQIARKPPKKLRYMLQLVHDTAYVSRTLRTAGWPSAWFAAEQSPNQDPSAWKVSDDQRRFSLTQETAKTSWLRYRHVPPSEQDWQRLIGGQDPPKPEIRRGELITDFYAYNSWKRPGYGPQVSGNYWVGDLGLEAEIQVQSKTGTLLLDAVEGGRHHVCTIDVASGQASAEIESGKIGFSSLGEDPAPTRLVGTTPIRRPGKYRLRWVNADDQLVLWVDDRPIAWSVDGKPHPGHYLNDPRTVPRWSPNDPGDLNPVGIGGSAIDLTVTRLRVLRDVYYTAVQTGQVGGDYARGYAFEELKQLFASPEDWANSEVFGSRRDVTFKLDADQFFPMGDNSPCSQDARIWSGPRASLVDGLIVNTYPWVDRELLIGKAFLVYWPHAWDLGPIPLRIVPNIWRMQRIH